MAACFASILELPIESCEADISDDKWLDNVQKMLSGHGYLSAALYEEDIVYGVPAGIWVSSVASRNLGFYDDGTPIKHAVVMLGLTLMHDPAITNKRTEVKREELLGGAVLIPLSLDSQSV